MLMGAVANMAPDLFLGIITPNYGSGVDGDDLSITHQEIRRALELEKPRWLLTHCDVVFARRLLRDLGYGSKERGTLDLKKGARSLSDLRVLDLYEEATLNEIPLADRKGNWVQEYQTDEDALLFATAQFSRYQEVEQFLKENLANAQSVSAEVERRRGDRS